MHAFCQRSLTKRMHSFVFLRYTADMTTDVDILALGDGLRMRREALDLSQSDVAELAGCSRATVGEIERGKATAQLDNVLAICRVLGLRMMLEPRS